jgi:hypothetical protein
MTADWLEHARAALRAELAEMGPPDPHAPPLKGGPEYRVPRSAYWRVGEAPPWREDESPAVTQQGLKPRGDEAGVVACDECGHLCRGAIGLSRHKSQKHGERAP